MESNFGCCLRYGEGEMNVVRHREAYRKQQLGHESTIIICLAVIGEAPVELSIQSPGSARCQFFSQSKSKPFGKLGQSSPYLFDPKGELYEHEHPRIGSSDLVIEFPKLE